MSNRGLQKKSSLRKGLLFTGFILLLSYFTYVHNYATPASYFWDENYHIPSAQKYMNGIFFMEPHPPLGKMLIALGEVLTDANALDDQTIHADYGRTVPPDFSFKGFRFFPVFFSWLAAPLMLWIFLLLVKDWLNATMLSFLYVFDNALIVHNRGAMLDPPMLFFCIAMMLLFLLMLRWKDHPRLFYSCALLFGINLGLVLATKVLGLIMILLIPALFVPLYPRIKQMAWLVILTFVSCLTVYVGIWQLHFSIASTVQTDLAGGGYYKASEEYIQILREGKNKSLTSFPIMWRDSMKFMRHYSGGVPKLDLCKPDENGSPFFFWPFGGRTINYRWETANNGSYAYLYLVPNPVGWLAGLIGIVVGTSLVLTSFLHPLKSRMKNRYLLLTFLGLYVSYMIAVSRLSRVMYLYHYFIPLLFSFLLFSIVYMEVQTIGRWKCTDHARRTGLLVFGMLVFVSFQFYRPLTYNLPLTEKQFERRDIIKLWDMHCVECERNKLLVSPRDCPMSRE